MKKILMIATLIALPVGLSGCDKNAEVPETEAPANTMGGMAMPAEIKTGTGTGTVTAIDIAKGLVTLDHGPVTELQWPAMKMGFEATPDALKDLAIGDKIAFEFQWDGKAGKLTKIDKQ